MSITDQPCAKTYVGFVTICMSRMCIVFASTPLPGDPASSCGQCSIKARRPANAGMVSVAIRLAGRSGVKGVWAIASNTICWGRCCTALSLYTTLTFLCLSWNRIGKHSIWAGNGSIRYFEHPGVCMSITDLPCALTLAACIATCMSRMWCIMLASTPFPG